MELGVSVSYGWDRFSYLSEEIREAKWCNWNHGRPTNLVGEKVRRHVSCCNVALSSTEPEEVEPWRRAEDRLSGCSFSDSVCWAPK